MKKLRLETRVELKFVDDAGNGVSVMLEQGTPIDALEWHVKALLDAHEVLK